MATRILLALLLSFLLCGSLGRAQTQRRCSEEAQQCRLDRLRARPPSRRIESEGGTTELWDETDEEFRCAGVAAVRNTIRTNSLSLPKFHSAPMLIFVERGRGYMGLNYPGCAETYEAQSGQYSRRWLVGQRTPGERDEDQHQKVRRIFQGDMIAVRAGTVHWFYNDAGEDLVLVAFSDLNNDDNQLDLRLRSFYLAGGVPSGGRRGEERRSDELANIFKGFDPELFAEALSIPSDLVRRMQEETAGGSIVRCDEEMTFVTPDEQEEELSATTRLRDSNGLEETICTARIKHNMNTQREADLYTREAGRINILNHHKLPILRELGMSAEKGHLFPGAQYNLQWSMTDHRVVYVVAGEAEVQITDDYGNTVFNERVNRGNIFTIPQFYATLARAGDIGFEWITFKTSSEPMKSAAVGYTSVFQGLPLQVLEQIFQMSTREAEQLKWTRRQHTYLLPPPTRRSS